MKKLYNEKTLITLFILSIVVLFGCQKTDDVSEQNDWLPPHLQKQFPHLQKQLQEQMQGSRKKTREQQDKENEKLYKEIRKENWKQWLLIFKKANYNVLFSVRKSEKWISEHLNEATLEASDYLNETESLEWLSENGYEVEKSSDGSTTIKKTIKKRLIPDEAIKDMREAGVPLPRDAYRLVSRSISISIGDAQIIARPLLEDKGVLTALHGKFYIKEKPPQPAFNPHYDIFYGTGLPSGVDSFVIIVDLNGKHRVIIK